MVKASVFPGTPRARDCPPTCDTARRQARCVPRPPCPADTRAPAPSAFCVRRGHERPRTSRQHRQAIGLRSSDKTRTPEAVADHRAGSRKRAESTPRPENEGGRSACGRHFPHASAQPRPRLARRFSLLPGPQKNSCGTNVFGTSFPLNAHENPQQNLPDALTENRYFTRTKVY